MLSGRVGISEVLARTLWTNEQSETDGGTLAEERPEIILTNTSGELLDVDVLAYPEDTYLVVDPYTALEEPDASMGNLLAEAQAKLPRPIGEIITVRGRGVEATWLLRLVLLDFNRWPHCRAKEVEETLRQLIWNAGLLGGGSVGLDRLEFLEPCISAYRVVSCLCQQVTRLRAARVSPLATLIFSLNQPSAMRHYEFALTNLPDDLAKEFKF